MRVNMTQTLGRVVKSYQGDGESAWRVDVLTNDGPIIESALVISPKKPTMHTSARPSLAIVGYFGANIMDAWAIPVPWASAQASLASHQHLDVYKGVTLAITNGGTLKVLSAPGGAEALVVDPDGAEDGPTVALAGGEDPVARMGDQIAITQGSSPAFFNLLISIVQALGALGQNGPAAALLGMLDPIEGEEPPEEAQIVGVIANGSEHVTTR